MTKDRKKAPKRSEAEARKEPRVKKETVKDLDPKNEAENLKGGFRSGGCHY